MKSQAIVTLADSNYFDLLLELISSIKQFEQSKNIPIGVRDEGLRDEQIQSLNNKVEIIKKANWDIEVPKVKVLGKEWLKSQISRAFLPDYFPDFKKFLWLDCDCWVNTWECVDIYFNAFENGKIGITQTIGAGYKVLTRVKWILGSLATIKSQNYKHAKKSGFSENIARKIAFAPHLNIGVFSLEKDSGCWKIWQENLKKTEAKLKKGQFSLEDYLSQLRQMKKMGGIEGIMSFLPGVSKIKSQMDQAGVDEKIITQNEAVILSMTKLERENPKIIDGSRKKRIAIGSGTDAAAINKLLKQFKMMSEMMKKMSKGNLKGMSDKGIPPELFNKLK